MKTQILTALIFIALFIGVGGGYWLAKTTTPGTEQNVQTEMQQKTPLFYRNPMNPEITSPVAAKDEMGMDYIPVYADKVKKERKPLFFRNPMNPDITSPIAAKDEMGMDYIPVFADKEMTDAPAGSVQIDPVTVQNIGVRTTRAQQRTLSRSIRAVGRIAFNEERLSRLHPKTEGWIVNVLVDKTGSQVKNGDILLNIYSPQLVSSQEEYLLALKNKQILAESPYEDIRQGAIDLVNTARERLELFDVPEHQIEELEKSGKIKRHIHIHSPFDGAVMNVGIREGQYVTPKTELYNLADLSKVWVYADIYEYELPWVQIGDKVDMQISAVPGKTFSGHLGYIYPYAEAKTRTVKVRLEFINPKYLLKPDMFADVTIHAGRQMNAIVIPSQAVVRSGTREQVFVVRGPGKFEPRIVKLGISSEGMTQILSGLKADEEVVSSAVFLIDSESKLREATAKMMETLSAPPASSNTSSDNKSKNSDAMNMDDMDMQTINTNQGIRP